MTDGPDGAGGRGRAEPDAAVVMSCCGRRLPLWGIWADTALLFALLATMATIAVCGRPHGSAGGTAVMMVVIGIAFLLLSRLLFLAGIPGSWAVVDRWKHVVYNWRHHTLRSYMELGAWFAALHTAGTLTESRAVAAAVGTVTGMVVILASSLLSEAARRCGRSMNRVKVSVVDLPPPEKEQDQRLLGRIVPTLLYIWIATFAAFHIAQAAGAHPISRDASTAIGAVGACGVLFVLAGDFLARHEQTHLFGRVILHRLRNTAKNWRTRPLRSGAELAVWCAAAAAALCSGPGAAGGFWQTMLRIQWAHAAGVAAVCVGHLRVEFLPAPAPGALSPAGSPPQSPRGTTTTVFSDGTARAVHKDSHNRILRVLAPTPPPGGRKLIGVDGKWYDVTAFIPYHPGGDVLEEFVGRDATAQVLAFHSRDVLRGRQPVGEYERVVDPAERDFEALLRRLRAEGWYDPPVLWFTAKCLVCAALLGGAAACLRLPCPAWLPQSVWSLWLPILLLGLFWQQSAFMAHDLMHNSTFQRREVDQKWGWLFGNVCFGVSSVWWRDEHFEHHFFTNTLIPGVGCGDPQQFEKGLWAQDPKLRAFAPERISLILAKLQGYTFLPLCVMAGRVGICVASLTMERSFWQHFGIILHWAITSAVLSGCPSWQSAGAVWYGAACVQGVLAVQLCVSHYDKPFVEKNQVAGTGWMRRQAETVKDIECPWWLDWFHGGLNYHMVHHLMPRMPRARFRQATVLVDELCAKHAIKVDRRDFIAGVADIVRHMDRMAHFAGWKQILFGTLI
eukprot:TRINITY_DN60054_c0_g1_i1.p1 TRINITY_DN60054_c0_g1~~TRINITY_DN60054_c0_g1_i1.p1  ORF type:complete len:788 (+),score=253.74 TRINITY_DN60054_c0_g1_i1:104-2467(+)